MATYYVVPNIRNKAIYSWSVRKKGLLSLSTLRTFTERSSAVDYAKYIGDGNRPSRVLIYDGRGNMVFSFSYGKSKRVYK